jgi:putative transposase
VNRQTCFFADTDRALYIATLADMCARFAVSLHAFVLMTNHAHLLMTPTTTWGISRVMQGLGRIYVRRVNDRLDRTGTLWEGRHRDSLVDSDRYLLACQRYIEMNPVRAGIVHSPEEYVWSSHRANLSGAPASPLRPHAVYLGLGSTPAARNRAYSSLFEIEDDDAVQAFRDGIRRRFPVGDGGFLERLRGLGVTLGEPRGGRPSAPDTSDAGRVGAGVVAE